MLLSLKNLGAHWIQLAMLEKEKTLQSFRHCCEFAVLALTLGCAWFAGLVCCFGVGSGRHAGRTAARVPADAGDLQSGSCPRQHSQLNQHCAAPVWQRLDPIIQATQELAGYDDAAGLIVLESRSLGPQSETLEV
jgi:hypothetical protein